LLEPINEPCYPVRFYCICHAGKAVRVVSTIVMNKKTMMMMMSPHVNFHSASAVLLLVMPTCELRYASGPGYTRTYGRLPRGNIARFQRLVHGDSLIRPTRSQTSSKSIGQSTTSICLYLSRDRQNALHKTQGMRLAHTADRTVRPK